MCRQQLPLCTVPSWELKFWPIFFQDKCTKTNYLATSDQEDVFVDDVLCFPIWMFQIIKIRRGSFRPALFCHPLPFKTQRTSNHTRAGAVLSDLPNIPPLSSALTFHSSTPPTSSPHSCAQPWELNPPLRPRRWSIGWGSCWRCWRGGMNRVELVEVYGRSTVLVDLMRKRFGGRSWFWEVHGSPGGSCRSLSGSV